MLATSAHGFRALCACRVAANYNSALAIHGAVLGVAFCMKCDMTTALPVTRYVAKRFPQRSARMKIMVAGFRGTDGVRRVNASMGEMTFRDTVWQQSDTREWDLGCGMSFRDMP
jgi:hypothetical protein